ncbi:MAG TPA: sigma-70 family RNA polymerase sigma factor [Phycisphaerales bacterium]|nr:sigma-70 family RNA polymerase sigma factor [Phycisphaerales bacterium]
MTSEKVQSNDFSGDKASFVDLLMANYYRIHAFVLSMVPNDTDADDIMQETAMLMWKNFDQFQAGTNFVAWAVTIAKFQVMKYHKQIRRSRLVLSEKTYDLLIEDNKGLESGIQDRFRALRKCIQSLPRKDQNFIELRYSRGATAKSVAQTIGASVGAVYRYGARLNDLLLRCIRQKLAVDEA